VSNPLLKPRGLLILATTRARIFENLLNSFVLQPLYEIRPGKARRPFSKKRHGFGWIWQKMENEAAALSASGAGDGESNPREAWESALCHFVTTPRPICL